MNIKLITSLSAFLLSSFLAHADLYKIAGVTIDDKNAVRKALVVEGPAAVRDFGNTAFGRYSESYLDFTGDKVNLYKDFDHSKSIGRLMGRGHKLSFSRHVTLPLAADSLPAANIHRTTIELSWGDHGLENKTGADFVIFEAGGYEAFAVSIRKNGSTEFSAPRYQFANTYDRVHQCNAVMFDLSDLGLKEGEVIAALRIRNVFNGKARVGSDRVDNASGEGNIVYPNSSKYSTSHPLRVKADGEEFSPDRLGADIVYVAALHDIVPISTPDVQAQAK